MPQNDFWEIVGWALACSVPVVLAGALIIRLARSWSLAVSMVALVLIPTIAAFPGVPGAQGFHGDGDFRADGRGAGDRVDRDDSRRRHDGPIPGSPHRVGAGDPRG